MYEYEYTEDKQINIYRVTDEGKTLVCYQPNFDTEEDGAAFAVAEIASLEKMDAFLAELEATREARLAEAEARAKAEAEA